MALELLVLAEPMVAANQLGLSQSVRLGQSARLFRKASTFQKWPFLPDRNGCLHLQRPVQGTIFSHLTGAFLWHYRFLISATPVCVVHNNASASSIVITRGSKNVLATGRRVRVRVL